MFTTFRSTRARRIHQWAPALVRAISLFIMLLLVSSKCFGQLLCPSPETQTVTAPAMPTITASDFTGIPAGKIANRMGLNDPAHNKWFLCTLKWVPMSCCQVMQAVLTVTSKSNQNGISHTDWIAGDDRIGLVHNGAAIGLPNSDWMYSSFTFPVNTPKTTTLTITGPAFAALRANNRLSFYVEDDTRIESAVLVLTYCCVNWNGPR